MNAKYIYSKTIEELIKSPQHFEDGTIAIIDDNNGSDTSSIFSSITGYDESKTQILKNINGVITWVNESQVII